MQDIQLLEIVARPQTWRGAWKFRNRLEKVIRTHSKMATAEMNSWSAIKPAGVGLFLPGKGWDVRSLQTATAKPSAHPLFSQ